MDEEQIQELERRLATEEWPTLGGSCHPLDPVDMCLRVANGDTLGEVHTHVYEHGPGHLNRPESVVERLRRLVDRHPCSVQWEIPDGYHALVYDEFVREGDLRVVWGWWVYVDHTKRYGSGPATTKTFGGPVIRECHVETFMHGEQEALF